MEFSSLMYLNYVVKFLCVLLSASLDDNVLRNERREERG